MSITLRFFTGTLILALNSSFLFAQAHADLYAKLNTIASSYQATIGVAVQHIEKGDTLTFNNSMHYPMQSVYKFPLALTVLKRVDEKQLSLDQKIHVTKADLHPNTWSPLRDKYPAGEVDVTIRELLQYTVSTSDNNACDILFNLMGGTQPVHDIIQQWGVSDIAIVATEHEMTKAWDVQYTNWCTPSAMNQLLIDLYRKKYLSPSSTEVLMQMLINASTGSKRIKGNLSSDIVVAHKTGTSDTNAEGVQAACNDVGIITLRDGKKHIALSVFVKDSKEQGTTNEKIIAEVARAVYDHFVHSGK